MDGYEKMPWPNGLKKTKQRLKVLEALCESGKPVSVQEISEILSANGSPMWFSTIYRVLDVLAAHGIIQKAAVHESGMAVYELGDAHRHYAVCVGCRRVIPINGCPLESFLPELQDKSFRVLGHKLQISGYCGDCCDKSAP